MQACNEYLRAGIKRNATAMIKTYPNAKNWSMDYGWVGRAAEYDARIDEEKTQTVQDRRRASMEEGLANDFERVDSLKKLAAKLWAKIEKSVEVVDTKQIGSGENAERVTVRRFNGPLIEQFRGVLDDIAKEKGERKQVMDIKLIREEAAKLADEFGLDKDEVVAEADAIVKERGLQ